MDARQQQNQQRKFFFPIKLYNKLRFSKMSTVVTTDDLISTSSLKRNFTFADAAVINTVVTMASDYLYIITDTGRQYAAHRRGSYFRSD